MTVQFTNSELINLLSSEFQRRNEPQFSLDMTLALLRGSVPNKVGLWLMDSVAPSNGNTFDTSGAIRTLTNNTSAVNFGSEGLIPFADFDGISGSYLVRLDEAALDITGLETFIINKGLSMGCWFYPTVSDSGQQLIGKWQAAPFRSYRLVLTAANKIQLNLSVDGSGVFAVTSPSSVNFNEWNSVFCSYIPSGDSSIFLNGVKTTSSSSPISLFQSTSNLVIGSNSAGANVFTGKISMCFLSASSIADNPANGDLVPLTLHAWSSSLFSL